MSLHILWLQTGAQIGGTEMMNFRTWQWLNPEEIKITICFLDEEGPVSDLYHQAGCEPIHLRYHERPLRAVWHDLRHLLSSQPIDGIHIFGTRANMLGRLAVSRTTSAKIVCGQRSVGSGNRWPRWVERLTSRWVDLYIANSQAGASWLAEKAQVPRSKIIAIHSGLDATPFIAAPSGQIRPSLHITPSEIVIVSIGNLRKVKDQETLIMAAALLRDQGHAFHLLLVGEGQCRTGLESLASALNMQGCFHFLGRRTDVSAILADADIKVLSSRTEGLPAAIMEAMAAGLPVVATAVGGIPELVQDGVTGLLVPPDDPPALAEALATMLNDPRLRQQYGRAGQQRIQTHFALADKVAELQQAYQSFL